MNSLSQISAEITGLIKNEYRSMINYAKYLASDLTDEDSEDIIQDILTGMFALQQGTDPERTGIANPAAYLYRAIKNRVINRFGSKSRNTVSMDSDENQSGLTLHHLLQDLRFESSYRLEQQQLAEAVHNAIKKLPPAEQAVIIATEFENRSYKELSLEWGEPAGTLLSRKSRAMGKLRLLLSRIYTTESTRRTQ